MFARVNVVHIKIENLLSPSCYDTKNLFYSRSARSWLLLKVKEKWIGVEEIHWLLQCIHEWCIRNVFTLLFRWMIMCGPFANIYSFRECRINGKDYWLDQCYFLRLKVFFPLNVLSAKYQSILEWNVYNIWTHIKTSYVYRKCARISKSLLMHWVYSILSLIKNQHITHNNFIVLDYPLVLNWVRSTCPFIFYGSPIMPNISFSYTSCRKIEIY